MTKIGFRISLVLSTPSSGGACSKMRGKRREKEEVDEREEVDGREEVYERGAVDERKELEKGEGLEKREELEKMEEVDEKGREWQKGLTKGDHGWRILGREREVKNTSKAVGYLV